MDREITHEVRELIWAFDGPGLLDANAFPGRVETDAVMRARIHEHDAQLEDLKRDPTPLREFLETLPTHGRLGRYFEHLLRFYLVHLARVSQLIGNLQVRDAKKTLGELDLIFRENPVSRPVHWEASVKFYLCTTEDPLEAREERFYMGTLVSDRMDVKIAKLLDRQLTLPQNPFAAEALAARQFEEPRSFALLKGFLFYPTTVDWRTHPHPASISPVHTRGWWTTAGLKRLPSEKSKYMLLPPARWLAPYEGPVAESEMMTAAKMRSYIDHYFNGVASLTRELMVAEIAGDSHEVREISRGHILHADWPPHARHAALT